MLKITDVIVILLVAGITVFSAYNALKPRGNARVLIRGQGSVWTFPLDATETVAVSGPLGETLARIGGNQAWVEYSPCDNQTCVATGLISRQGQWAACLPNNVLLMIQGSGGEDADVVTW